MKHVLLAIVVALTLTACIGLFAPGGKGFAYIYESRETGKLLFCSNDQGNNVRDFKFVGTGQVDKDKIKFCALEKN